MDNAMCCFDSCMLTALQLYLFKSFRYPLYNALDQFLVKIRSRMEGVAKKKEIVRTYVCA